MPPIDAAATEALARRLEASDLRGLWIIFHDYSARASAKWVPREDVPDALRVGGIFAKAQVDFTFDDQMASGARYTADTGDFFAVPDPGTFVPVPYLPGMGRVLTYLCMEEGDLWDGCPRGRLDAQVAALSERGLSVRAAFEPELTLYRQADNEEYQPADPHAMYSVDRISSHHTLLQRIVDTLGDQGVRVVQIGGEWGAGQVEINLAHQPPLKAADDLLTFRETVKALSRDAGLLASFMPKPFADAAGNGLHIHLSLWDATGEENRSEGDQLLGLSPELTHFMAGVLEHARAICGVGAPTVNSYKRLLPGSWAPAHIAYGGGNRSVLVRVPGTTRRRIEFRAGDHTSNPYLFLAALIAAGLDGIDRGLDPGPPAEGDIGHLGAGELARQGLAFLPRTAAEALDAVESDGVVMAALGPVCGPGLLRVKRDELARYDTYVGEWERAMFFERA
jgi:glutamine synthetase